MAIETKQLNALSKIYQEAVYGGAKKEAPKDNRLVVTAADKKANTKAYQNYKAGNKAYKAADHLKSEGYQRDPEQQEKERKTSKQTDPSKDGFTGIGNSIKDIMKQNAAMKKAAAKKTKKEEFVSEGPSDKSVARTKAWMDKKGEKGAPGLDAHKERMQDHKAKRGVKKEAFVSWRHDLKEIPDYEQIPASAKKRNEKIEEKDVKNTIKINPEMKESVGSAIDKTLGAAGEIADTAVKLPAKAIGYAKGLKKGLKKAAKKGEDKASGDASPKNESYETTKRKEVLSALKRDKRPLDKKTKEKIAAKIVKDKGDTSKSDDRYAYESKLWDEVAENLTELGELGGVKYKVVPLDESDIADILARLEKKRISKGGNPDESPLGKKTGRAMKAQQDKARKKAGVE